MRLVLTYLIVFISIQANAQSTKSWEDSVLNKMTLDEKIGQLFMIAAYSNKDDRHIQEIEQAINQYHVGGLIFFQGTASKQVYLTNYYQTVSKTPLFIAQDAEWGVKMRLTNAPKYPYQMTLGACTSRSLSYEAGRSMGQELKRLGVHISFSPVADINNNPNNPIIGFRSFGENRENVADKTVAMAHGLQSERIIACAKHFPGHGNTSTDSHLDLPIIKGNKKELDSIELYPFKRAVDAGVIAAMVAHVHLPGLDNTPNMPASLSPKVVKAILRDELNFQGLVFTDAMNMKGVAKFFKHGEGEVMALLAGNDIILYPENLAAAFEAIKKAIADGRISELEINQKVKKIMYYKRWVGLNNYKATPTGDIESDIFKIAEENQILNQAAMQSITLVSNKKDFLPIDSLSRYAHVSIGEGGENEFYNELKRYVRVSRFNISAKANIGNCLQLKGQLKQFDSIIISFHNPSVWSNKSYGFSDEVIRLVNELESENNVAIVLFCNPYLTKYFVKTKTLVVAYEDEPVFRTTAATMLLGMQLMVGHLPFKPSLLPVANPLPLSYFSKSGINAYNANFQGLDTNKLKRIDYILDEVVQSGAAPGGQVLVAKNGKIIYEKAFGRYTYGSSQMVTPNTMYDVASITKAYASSLMGMKLYDLGMLSIEATLDTYIPETKGKAVGKIKIRELMLHQAGLPAWIPFYKETLGVNFSKIYATKKDGVYQLPVASNMFMDTMEAVRMMDRIYNSTLTSRGSYKYSDLSLILLKKVMENIAQMPMDSFLYYNFYKPLGLKHTGFNMYRTYPIDAFAPSEDDGYFRQQIIQGYVHDMGAAMFGGVSGHAGLFSNAEDMLVISEMLRNKGNYNGVSYINPTTIALFTSQQNNSCRRGLVFDKPEGRKGYGSPTSESCPISAFGHTGFTGTCVWIDPTNNLVYIFLSNRTFPTMENNKLVRGNYRDKIQETVYNALKK